MSEKKAKTKRMKAEVNSMEEVTNTIIKIKSTLIKVFPTNDMMEISGIIKDSTVSLENFDVIITKFTSYLFSLLFTIQKINVVAVKSFLDNLLFIAELNMLSVTDAPIYKRIAKLLALSFLMEIYHNEKTMINSEAVKKIYVAYNMQLADKTKAEYEKIYSPYYDEEQAKQIAEYVSRHNETLKQYYAKLNAEKPEQDIQ